MKLQKMILKNFRPFYNRHELDLHISEEKPLIVIKALNDVGKTSLFKAFYWCLYGGRRNENRLYVNRTASLEREGEMSVELVFTHDDNNFQILRTLDFSQSDLNSSPNVSDDELRVIKNGKPEQLLTAIDQEEYIQAILPEEASQFFLFDGEEIQRYTQREFSQGVKGAIEMVLGITELRNARKDLTSISKEIDREIDALLLKKSKRDSASTLVKELGEEIDQIETDINNIDKQIIQVKETIDFCDENLRRFKEIEGKITERRNAEEQFKLVEERIKNTEDNQKNFNNDFGLLILSPLFDSLASKASTTYQPWRREAISFLLAGEAQHCICRREITPDIRDYFTEVVFSRKDTIIKYLSAKTQSIKNDIPQDLENTLYDLAQSRAGLELSLRSWENDKKRLDEEIGNFKEVNAEIDRFEEMRERADASLTEYKETKIEKEYEHGIKKSDHVSKRNALAKQMGTSKDLSDMQNLFDTCRDSENAIKYVIDTLVSSSKRNVEEMTSEVFLELTNAPSLYAGIEITDNYEIRVKTKGGAVRNVWEQIPSSGQSQIIAMSFISALNRFTAREAPVIIDTPIGRLDPIHKQKIIEYFHNIASQVIILYQPNEMNDEDIKHINRFISSEYEFTRDMNNPDTTVIIRGV